jgi:flagellar biosynthesis protein FlhF
MDVRTFEAFSMKDAIKSVKRELGADAVILSTTEKKTNDGSGSYVEVKAAAPEAKRSGGRAQRPDHLDSAALDSPMNDSISGININLQKLSEEGAGKRQIDSLETSMTEIKSMLIESLRTKSGSIIKNLPKVLIPIERTLRTMGLDPANIAELVTYLKKIPAPTGTEEENEASYRDQAIRFLMKRIKIAASWTVMPGTCCVQAVIGPNASGKSTTTAKLAAHYHLKRKAKVLVVSFDNNRLAASEQMRLYCKIIGVPFEVISDVSDLNSIIAKNSDVELILIDTAGTSPKSESGISEIDALKECDLPIDFHLCLSVTEKEEQMDRSVRSFSKIGIQSLIFTKLDESWSFGEIFNLSKKWTLPLSYFSIGPDVPDDIEKASRERVIERIFGL